MQEPGAGPDTRGCQTTKAQQNLEPSEVLGGVQVVWYNMVGRVQKGAMCHLFFSKAPDVDSGRPPVRHAD